MRRPNVAGLDGQGVANVECTCNQCKHEDGDGDGYEIMIIIIIMVIMIVMIIIFHNGGHDHHRVCDNYDDLYSQSDLSLTL